MTFADPQYRNGRDLRRHVNRTIYERSLSCNRTADAYVHETRKFVHCFFFARPSSNFWRLRIPGNRVMGTFICVLLSCSRKHAGFTLYWSSGGGDIVKQCVGSQPHHRFCSGSNITAPSLAITSAPVGEATQIRKYIYHLCRSSNVFCLRSLPKIAQHV